MSFVNVFPAKEIAFPPLLDLKYKIPVKLLFIVGEKVSDPKIFKSNAPVRIADAVAPVQFIFAHDADILMLTAFEAGVKELASKNTLS